MQSSLKLDIDRTDQCVVVAINGEIDIFSGPDFKARMYEIFECGRKNVVFDCKELMYIDSFGLGVFVSLLKKSKQQDLGMKLENVRNNIMKLFVITGLDKIIDIERGDV